ncbi:MAG: 3-deoxy-manno-octulosonate cytidylyltransferase [Pyrinomonadaceae bacterium]
MESHGKNPEQFVAAIIPARYASTRLPGKLLLPLGGRPLILHTVDRSRAARNVDRVIVATDDERIAEVAAAEGVEVVMTSTDHPSGSDRIAEVARDLPAGTIVVNVQGDEPLIPSENIEKAVECILKEPSVDIATTCEPIDDVRDVLDPNVVKVVTDVRGNALYFSRSPVPFPRAAALDAGSIERALQVKPELVRNFRKHTGLYVYRREFLLRFAAMEPSPLETLESLEQLRALENGATIRVVEVSGTSIGVDTLDDYERVRSMIEMQI